MTTERVNATIAVVQDNVNHYARRHLYEVRVPFSQYEDFEVTYVTSAEDIYQAQAIVLDELEAMHLDTLGMGGYIMEMEREVEVELLATVPALYYMTQKERLPELDEGVEKGFVRKVNYWGKEQTVGNAGTDHFFTAYGTVECDSEFMLREDIVQRNGLRKGFCTYATMYYDKKKNTIATESFVACNDKAAALTVATAFLGIPLETAYSIVDERGLERLFNKDAHLYQRYHMLEARLMSLVNMDTTRVLYNGFNRPIYVDPDGYVKMYPNPVED